MTPIKPDVSSVVDLQSKHLQPRNLETPFSLTVFGLANARVIRLKAEGC